MNYYPIINKNVIKVKSIDDKTIIFLKELNEKKIILNNAAKAIFDSCDGSNGLCEIIKINAGDCELKKQQNKDIMEILKKFNDYGILLWRHNENPFFKAQCIDNMKIYNVRLDTMYLIKNKFKYSLFNIDGTENDVYDKKFLTNGIYSKLIKIYYIEHNMKPLSLIIFVASGTGVTWQLNRMYYNDNSIIFENFINFLKYVKNDLSSTVYKKDTSIGFYINTKSGDKKIYEELGFREKGLLKYESSSNLHSMWAVIN